MNIKESKIEIKNTVLAYLEKDEDGCYVIPAIRQRPILLMGPPGIGKTQIMEQIARECKISLVSYTITHHTRQSAVGLPYIEKINYDGKEYSVTKYTMSEIIVSIHEKIEETGIKEGILFIDEINCVSETLAPTMLQFLQCKTFGNQKIPEGFIIVAAGNPPEYNKSVRDFDVVTLDRVRRMDIEPDYFVWRDYARDNNIDFGILSYLNLHQNNFYKMEADVDGMQFVTARGWEDLSYILKMYRKKKIPVTSDIVYEFLRNHDVAEDVAAYLELYDKYQDDYGIDDILKGNVGTEIYRRLYDAKFDERLTVVNLVVEKLMFNINKYQELKKLTDSWYLFLKEYRKKLDDFSDGYKCYLKLLEDSKEKYNSMEKSELYTKSEMKNQARLIKYLDKSVPKIGQDIKASFLSAKSNFDDTVEKMKSSREKLANIVENCFDFMEEAFTTGEEMVIFVTELTITSESALFFTEYECERYLKYSEELLVGTRRQSLLSELEEYD